MHGWLDEQRRNKEYNILLRSIIYIFSRRFNRPQGSRILQVQFSPFQSNRPQGSRILQVQFSSVQFNRPKGSRILVKRLYSPVE